MAATLAAYLVFCPPAPRFPSVISKLIFGTSETEAAAAVVCAVPGSVAMVSSVSVSFSVLFGSCRRIASSCYGSIGSTGFGARITDGEI